MERVIVLIFLILMVVIAGLILQTYGTISEPFVLTAVRKPHTRNTTGRYSDSDDAKDGSGFFHCRRDDDTSTENANLPTCREMREGMIQKAREDGQVPQIPLIEQSKYSETDVVGSIGRLQVILNRTAHPSRQQMCVPFVDCNKYINPSTKRLYCPVGISQLTDSKGNTIGCHSFPDNQMLHCETNTSPGDGRISCSILQNIQTVGRGFKLYPPRSTILAILQTNSETIVNEKSEIVLKMFQSYPNLIAGVSSTEISDPDDTNQQITRNMSVLHQYYEGVMESYILYQPMTNEKARVAFIQDPGKLQSIPDVSLFEDSTIPSFEITTTTFIPDTIQKRTQETNTNSMFAPLVV